MNLKKSIILMFLMLFFITSPTLAATKRFNLCFNTDSEDDQVKTLLKYGGLEIEAQCIYRFFGIPSIKWEAAIQVISNNSNTKTSFGFQLAPFNLPAFTEQSEASCQNFSNEVVTMVSEEGHYISLDGGSLVMCTNLDSCNCSITGVINKSRVKTKRINN